MKKLLFTAAAALLAAQSHATISVCLGTGAACDPVGGGDLENVLFNDEIGNPVTGTTVNSGLDVLFSSLTDDIEVKGGQAKLTSATDAYLNQVQVEMANPIFGLEVIRFSVKTDVNGLIDLAYADQNDVTVSNPYAVIANQRNWFTFLATDPDQIKNITIAGDNVVGIEDMRHFRIDPDILPGGGGGGGGGVDVDAPGQMALLGLGLIALGLQRRVRKD